MPTETDRRLVGVMLHAVREMAGVPRDRMAEECGVSAGTISHWESGRSIPARAHLKVWAELTGVALDDLYKIVGLSDAPISLPQYWRGRDRLHSALRDRAQSRTQDGATGPDDPDHGPLIRSQGYESVAVRHRRAS
jgi:transcriptional regulator with XRE-family HTH domain